jgi:hypothetical protein
MFLLPTGKYKQHVTVRLSTPMISGFDNFERVDPDIETAFLGAKRLLRLYQRERARFEAVLLPARRK